jgi:hypothetical protein
VTTASILQHSLLQQSFSVIWTSQKRSICKNIEVFLKNQNYLTITTEHVAK